VKHWHLYLLLALACSMLPLQQPIAWAEDAVSGAKITVDARPDITRVVPSGMVNYRIQITSKGKETIKGVDFTFPYDWRRYKLRTVQTQPGTSDWVRKLTGEQLVINWGEFKTFETRTVTVTFQVGEDVSIGSIIEPELSYAWESEQHSGRGDLTPHWVEVVQYDNRPPQARVEPAVGPPGATFQFYANHFFPGEPVETWLSAPSGTLPLGLRGTVSSEGEIWLGLPSDDLPTGDYALVIHGIQSGQLAVQAFRIR